MSETIFVFAFNRDGNFVCVRNLMILQRKKTCFDG